MRPKYVLLVVPFAMALAFLPAGSVYWGSYGTLLLALGAIGTGLLASRLADWRIGIGAAALFLVLQYAFTQLALLAGQDAIA